MSSKVVSFCVHFFLMQVHGVNHDPSLVRLPEIVRNHHHLLRLHRLSVTDPIALERSEVRFGFLTVLLVILFCSRLALDFSPIVLDPHNTIHLLLHRSCTICHSNHLSECHRLSHLDTLPTHFSLEPHGVQIDDMDSL